MFQVSIKSTGHPEDLFKATGNEGIKGPGTGDLQYVCVQGNWKVQVIQCQLWDNQHPRPVTETINVVICIFLLLVDLHPACLEGGTE